MKGCVQQAQVVNVEVKKPSTEDRPAKGAKLGG